MHLSETLQAGFYYLAPWLVFFPIIGLLINWILAKPLKFSENTVGAIASIASGAAFVVSILLAYSVFATEGEVVRWKLAEWIHIGNLELDWTFRIDSLSATMMLVVSGVGTLIHIYAIGYMHEDVRFKKEESRFTRFFIYLNLFIASMMILVSGDSYLMLFVGWEGVGLCSFLLIGFWFEMDTLAQPSWANSNAAKKAFVVNRIGDFGFLIAGFLMFWYLGSFQFDNVFEAAKNAPPEIIVAITLFMLVGVAGKSAQIPLYVWLPDAMAGPTPVSALIHAATMVTAGVYLITRSFPLYDLVPEAQHIVALVGAVTALFAATIAVGQYDIKKVLAYSTISQLGFMVAAVGMGAYVAGFFHLITHAFFKALLFLSAGSVILGLERGHHAHAHHEHHDEKPKKKLGKKLALSKVEGNKEEHHDSHGQGHDDHAEVFDPGDMRNMGGMRKTMPVTFWLYMIGTLALAGIFPFAGFWSKDEILLDASLHNQTVYWLLTIAAFFTAFYMGRQIWMVFFGEARTEAAQHAEESPKVMTIPLVVLAILSMAGGALNLPTIFGITLPGAHFLTEWLGFTLGEVEGSELNLTVAGVSTALALVAILISWLIYGRNPLKAHQPDPLKKPLGFIFTGMENKWYVDEIYDFLIRNPFKKLASFLADVIDWRFWHDFVHDTVILGTYNWIGQIALNKYADQKGIDRFFNSWADVSNYISVNVRKIQNGFVRSYALSVLLGVVLILGYLIFK